MVYYPVVNEVKEAVINLEKLELTEEETVDDPPVPNISNQKGRRKEEPYGKKLYLCSEDGEKSVLR